uniref:MalT-like TPR region domain-containing protein n=1 Tax=Aureoumbra lagunensis TaxID=44058 RepID=A0A7S3JYP9_9STRA|mmetsp:Transcript_2230/g.3499  ORF Transcript_2230/g.3499 Transcript_2230/m.3499 type:complete len:501 (+) Transcript_2230:59-1561(+)
MMMEENKNPVGYRIEKLNSLAFPKGQLPRCELTGNAATVACVTPWLTLYYESTQHADEAWRGIMHKIAPLLGPLRKPPIVVGTEEDRARRAYAQEMSKKALVDLCVEEADKFILLGKYELAVPASLQALNLLHDLYSEGCIQSLEPLSQLAEASLGLNRHKSAEIFLGRASCCIYKHPECTNEIRSKLHRQQGKLYLAQNKFDQALNELAKDVYCASLFYGPESIQVAPGYFYAASVFYAQHRIEQALAFYDKLVDIWFKFLANAQNKHANKNQSSFSTIDDNTLPNNVSRAQLALAADMLAKVHATRAKLLGNQHIASAEAKYTLGLLFLFQNPQDKSTIQIALLHLNEAKDIYFHQLGPNHPSTIDILQCLEQLSKFLKNDEKQSQQTPTNQHTLNGDYTQPDDHLKESQLLKMSLQVSGGLICDDIRAHTTISANSKQRSGITTKDSLRKNQKNTTNAPSSRIISTSSDSKSQFSLTLVGSSAPAKLRSSSATTRGR